MTDSEFIALAERTLGRIESELEDAIGKSEADLDWSHNDGILEIVGDEGGKIVVNRHVPNREIWLAAKSGAFHFRPDAGRWRDTRGGDELGSALARMLKQDLSLDIEPLELPAD